MSSTPIIYPPFPPSVIIHTSSVLVVLVYLPTPILQAVLLKSGPSAGKIAVIVEIIDHNRALIDNPAAGVPRQSFPYRHLVLTPFATTKLPRGAGSGTVKKVLEAEGIAEKWASSSWAKRRAALDKRRKLNDFQRFGVLLEKRRRRDVVRKAVKSAKKSAA